MIAAVILSDCTVMLSDCGITGGDCNSDCSIDAKRFIRCNFVL